MGRRSTRQSILDERAFPVRLRFAVPKRGLGNQLEVIESWLLSEIGRGHFAIHSSGNLGIDAMVVHLRDVEGAHAFARAFPMLALADRTEETSYTSPARDRADLSRDLFGVCNLYSMTKGQDAIRQMVQIWDDRTGNLERLAAIFPVQEAPVVFHGEKGRVLSRMRWGMPSPSFALKNRKTDSGITNVRNTSSPHWRRWLGHDHRCVVPFTSFCEYEHGDDGSPEPVWFGLDDDRPLAFFAGIWTRWTSVRKLKEGETTNDLFAFLTTEANAEVASVHPKAMPVVLRDTEEVDRWLEADIKEALTLQRPLPDGTLKIVARGERSDGA